MMKRKISILIAGVLAAFLLAVPAYAQASVMVDDQAGLLTEDEAAELEQRAEQLSSDYGCEVDLITMDSMEGDDAKEYAKELYSANGLGIGDDSSGILLFLSMENRDYALIAFGYGNTVLTDYGRETALNDTILPALHDDDYYTAFAGYYDTMENYLSMAAEGTPFDAGGSGIVRVLLCLFIPLGIAVAVCLFQLSKMHTAVESATAIDYLDKDKLDLRRQEDVFLYATQTRTKIEKHESGGGTTVDSDGFSGSSGKF